MSDQPCASGTLADIYEGSLNGSKVRIEKVRVYLDGDPQKVGKVCGPSWDLSSSSLQVGSAGVLQEGRDVEAPGASEHRPVSGSNPSSPQLVSVWAPTRGLTEYIKAHPGGDRLKLVSPILVVTSEALMLSSSYMMSFKA